MSVHRFAKSMEIFEAACELSGAERAAYLDRACRGDADLRREVEQLLAHDEKPAEILGQSTVGSGGRLIASVIAHEDLTHKLPERIASYRILGLIGEGGMGAVFEAEQEHPRRTVAVKVLRSALASREMRRRFEYEAQILGRLQHPGIAQVIEAGTADVGGTPAPYLVIERIHGTRIDQFAQDRNLGLRERLALFIRVCEAVTHAHQKAVIHRDLKPANILVVEQELATGSGSGSGSAWAALNRAAGQPKVLDFGLAKLMEEEGGHASLVTQVGRVQGTLAYMSPEQARGAADEIDLRSDVYSLGVILFELLSGTLPYDVDRASFTQAVQTICEGNPRPLAFGGRPLRGDLETIVRKALEKDPARRYASVAALAEDVTRFLTNQPILARRPSAMYQFRKLVMRHKLPFAFAATVFLMVLLGGMWMSILYARAVSAERAAHADAETARRTTAFLTDLFKVSDPSEARGNSITAREVLDRGATRVRAELVDQPAVRAALMNSIGHVYANLTLFDAARPLLEESLDLRRRQVAANPAGEADQMALMESLSALALLEEETGNLGGAETLIREALDIRLRVRPQEDLQLADLWNGLANALLAQGKKGEAERISRNVLEMRRRLIGDDHPDIAETLHNLAVMEKDKGRLAEAERLFREAVRIQRQAFGGQHPMLAGSLMMLAETLIQKGDFAAAEPFYQEAIAQQNALIGARNPRLADSLEGMGKVKFQRGEFAEAEKAFRSSIRLLTETLGDEHPRIVIAHNNLAAAQHRLGQLAEAADSLSTAVRIAKKTRGETHEDTAMVLSNLADLQRERGYLAEARSGYEEGLAMKRRIHGLEHPSVAWTLNGLAVTLAEMGELEAAEPLAREAVAMRRKLLGPNSTEVGQSLCTLGEILSQRGSFDEAQAVLTEGTKILRERGGEDHPYVAYGLAGLGNALLRHGDFAAAEAPLRQALDIRQRKLPADHWETAATKVDLAACLMGLDRFDEAEELLLSSLPILEAAKGPDHYLTKQAMERLSRLSESTGRPQAVSK